MVCLLLCSRCCSLFTQALCRTQTLLKEARLFAAPRVSLDALLREGLVATERADNTIPFDQDSGVFCEIALYPREPTSLVVVSRPAPLLPATRTTVFEGDAD